MLQRRREKRRTHYKRPWQHLTMTRETLEQGPMTRQHMLIEANPSLHGVFPCHLKKIGRDRSHFLSKMSIGVRGDLVSQPCSCCMVHSNSGTAAVLRASISKIRHVGINQLYF